MDGNPRRLSLTRYLAWAIVLGGHVFLIVLFSSNRPRESRAESSPEEPTVLLFLDVPPLPEEPAEKPTVARTKPRRERPPARAESDSSASTAPAAEAPSAPGRVDWYREAQRVAQQRGADLVPPQAHKCDPKSSDRPGSLLPKCGKHTSGSHEWEPEPKRAGFQGLLPYVRLGKRCAVGLGFFGCALGHLPEADGHVFDDMHEPDRPRSSVPDIPGKE